MQPELAVTQTTDLPQATQFAYQYDYRNRLIAAQRTDQEGKTVTAGTYLHDALGRRMAKATSEGTQVFLYDGDRVIEEIEPARGDVLARYVYGEEHIDNVLMMIKDADQDALITLVSADSLGGAPGPEVYVYHEDAQGSICAITGEVDNLGNGTKSLFVESCRYDSFGNAKIVDYLPPGDALTRKVVGVTGPPPDPGTLVSIHRLRSAIGNRFLYTGREMDYETGNQDFRRRTYDPRMGRFLQSDPIGIWGDPLNYGNGYSYCGNDPGTWTDRWGLTAGANQRRAPHRISPEKAQAERAAQETRDKAWQAEQAAKEKAQKTRDREIEIRIQGKRQEEQKNELEHKVFWAVYDQVFWGTPAWFTGWAQSPEDEEATAYAIAAFNPCPDQSLDEARANVEEGKSYGPMVAVSAAVAVAAPVVGTVLATQAGKAVATYAAIQAISLMSNGRLMPIVNATYARWVNYATSAAVVATTSQSKSGGK